MQKILRATHNDSKKTHEILKRVRPERKSPSGSWIVCACRFTPSIRPNIGYFAESSPYNDTRPLNYGKVIFQIMTREFKETVLERCVGRQDNWGQIVQARIGIVHNLISAEAKYHKVLPPIFHATDAISSKATGWGSSQEEARCL